MQWYAVSVAPTPAQPPVLCHYSHTMVLIAPLRVSKALHTKKIRLTSGLFRLETNITLQDKLASTVQYHTTSSFTHIS